MSSDKCFKCYRKGHWARDGLTSLGRKGSFLCDRGGETQCRHGGYLCYSCGKTGHIQRDCPHRECGPRCYRCGRLGHMAKDCLEFGPLNVQTQGQRCYSCSEKGHIARDCWDHRRLSQSETCYSCGGHGHSARTCTGERLARYSSEDQVKCFSCRKIGHIARDCYRSYRSNWSFTDSRVEIIRMYEKLSCRWSCFKRSHFQEKHIHHSEYQHARCESKLTGNSKCNRNRNQGSCRP